MDNKYIFGKLAFDSNRFKYIIDHYIILNYDMYQKYDIKIVLVDFSRMTFNDSIAALNALNNCEVKEARWDPANCKTEVYVSGKQFHLLEEVYKQFVYSSRHQIQKEVEESLSNKDNIINNIIPRHRIQKEVEESLSNKDNIINNITPEDIKNFVEEYKEYYENRTVSKDDDEEVKIQLSMTTNRKELKDIFEKYYDVSVGDFMTMTMYSNHNEELDKILCMLCSKEVLFELGTRIGEILACLNNLKQTEQDDENQKNIDHAFNEANELYKKYFMFDNNTNYYD
jgi:hypothetical protein|nr:MAG TPA: hypothetical protein [Caudoviricetes sp.]